MKMSMSRSTFAASSNRKMPASGVDESHGLNGAAPHLPGRIENETETNIADLPEKTSYQTKRLRMLALLRGQTEVLGAVSEQTPLRDTLNKVVELGERLFEPGICSIQILERETRQCVHLLGPSMPPGYRHALVDQCEVASATSTSAGAICMLSNTPFYLPDIEPARQHPRFSALALSYDLRACWAQPIPDRKRNSIGAITVFFRESRTPDADDKEILATLAEIVRSAVLLDRWRETKSSVDDRFVALAATMPGVVYQRTVTSDGDIAYTYISEGARELFGVTPKEILADSNALFDCHDAQYRANFRKRLLAASRELSLWDVEATIIARDGRRKFTHAIARPHREPDGTVVWNGVILDTTRIREAKLAAVATEERTRKAILESLSQGLTLYDRADRLVICNSHYMNLYPQLADLIAPGVSYETIITAKLRRGLVSAPQDEDTIRSSKYYLEAHRSGNFEAEWHLPDGRWVLVREQRTPDGGTVVLHTDVTDLKYSKIALLEAKESAEAANRAKSDFLANMSHELRTPLNAIIGFSELMVHEIKGPMGNEEYKEYVCDIRHSGQHLLNVINDILDLSKIESGKLALHEERMDVADIIDRVIRMIQGRADAAKLAVSCEISRNVSYLWADIRAVKQILLNLLSNAVKFTPEGGEVRLAADIAENGNICFTVSDTGIGISPENIHKVLQPFGQVDTGLSRNFEGTGLGLPLAKSLTELHGGEFEITSRPDAGTIVRVRLPRNRPIHKTDAA